MKQFVRITSIIALLVGLSPVSASAKCCLPAPEVEPEVEEVVMDKKPLPDVNLTMRKPVNKILPILGIAFIGALIASDDS